MKNKLVTVRSRMIERIRRTRKTDVFLRADFADFGNYDVVGRELQRLVRDEVLVRVGYGLYARAKPSILSGQPIPARPLIDIGYQALRRLGHDPQPPSAVQDYNAGRSTQVPAGDRVSVPGGRVRRKITFGSRVVEYV